MLLINRDQALTKPDALPSHVELLLGGSVAFLLIGTVGRRGRVLLLAAGLLGREHDGHALSLEHGHLVQLAIFLQVIGKPEQQHLALLLEQDGTSLEEDVALHLGTFLEETDGVLQLEVVVMLVGLWSETYFLDRVWWT